MVIVSRLGFSPVLLTLPKETIEQVRYLNCPCVALKERLLEILYTPKSMDQGFKLIVGAELGDRRPLQLM